MGIYEGGYLRNNLRGGGNLLFSTLFSARSWNCAKNRVCYRRDLAIDVRKKPNTKIFSEFREKFILSLERPQFWKLNAKFESIFHEWIYIFSC